MTHRAAGPGLRNRPGRVPGDAVRLKAGEDPVLGTESVDRHRFGGRRPAVGHDDAAYGFDRFVVRERIGEWAEYERVRREGDVAGRPGRAGETGEQLAAAFLRRERGYRIVARNWRSPRDRRAEVDLVCRDGDVLVFVEVKTRCRTPWCRNLCRAAPQEARHAPGVQGIHRATEGAPANVSLRHRRGRPAGNVLFSSAGSDPFRECPAVSEALPGMTSISLARAAGLMRIPTHHGRHLA